MTPSPNQYARKITAVRNYWNTHIHDLEVAQSPPGTVAFFDELDAYRFDKLHYLPHVIDFNAYRGKRLLEVGCGAGIDLVRFAAGGAHVTGIDLAQVSIDLARQNFAQRGLDADLHVMNGESLDFADDSFDTVYAHGVLQYTVDPARMVAEMERVLRPDGTAVFMVYNRRSWLMAMSKITNVDLEHDDAPAFRTYTIGEFRQLLRPFARHTIIPERFPVPTQLHHGLKAILYNGIFVRAFNILPKFLIRPFGWHLMAFVTKAESA